MDAAAQRYEFAPPPTPGLLRGLALAVLAHLLLLAGLAVGVNWKTDTTLVTAEAELWSAVPQQAAPRLVEAPPPPPPTPVVTAPEPPPVPRVSDADIAAERDKQRKLKQAEDARVLAQQTEKAQKLAQQKADTLKQQKLALDKKKAQEQAVLDKQKADKADAKAKEVAAAADAKAQEARRQANISRAAGLAGATGGPSATGTALRASGPSASYGGRIRARIKPNIVFTDDVAGNPTADVEVRTAPDGTIVGRKLLKPSGSPAWDEAILKAIDKTEVLPRDTDGTVPSSLVISFRPKD